MGAHRTPDGGGICDAREMVGNPGVLEGRAVAPFPTRAVT